LTPDNVLEALNQLQPSGIDLSSGVERSPGDKDLDKVAQLFDKVRSRRVDTNKDSSLAPNPQSLAP
jgi:phosphoribosylanthranilate isomerase